jgi:hypothetical protein
MIIPIPMHGKAILFLLLSASSPLCGQNLVAIDVVTDQFGSETIWQIDGMNVNFFAIGSGYTEFDEPGTYEQWTETYSLPDGNFNICVVSGEDGLCCDHGYGWITVRHVPSGTILFQTDSSFTADLICAQFTLPLGRIQGTLFLDDDQNCDAGISEARIPSQVLRVLPGPIHGLTDVNGDYDIRLPYGEFTIEVVSNGLVPICPGTEPVPFTVSVSEPIAQVMLGDSSVSKLDIVAAAVIGPARPGFSVTHTAQFTNASTYVSGPLTATAELDPMLTYTGASITPSMVSGNTLTWSLPALNGYTQHTIQVFGQLPADPTLLGEPLAMTVSAYQTLEETVLWNNQHTAQVIITGSYDPNDKTVWPHAAFYIATDSVLDYVIRFQNTGTDTAFTVVITDTLAHELDMGTFAQGAASHPYTLAFKPNRVVEWRFANILLPDSTVNEPASHGQVGFRIRPVQPLLPGTELRNSANIYFDFNPPVITEPSVLVATTGMGVVENARDVLHLAPNPAADVLFVRSTEILAGIQVTGIDGRVLPIATRMTGNGVELDVRTLAPGTYLIRTNHGTARFVKE